MNIRLILLKENIYEMKTEKSLDKAVKIFKPNLLSYFATHIESRNSYMKKMPKWLLILKINWLIWSLYVGVECGASKDVLENGDANQPLMKQVNNVKYLGNEYTVSLEKC